MTSCYTGPVLLSIRVPATNDRSPLYMEQVLAAVHQANPRRLPLRLGLGRHQNAVSLFLRFPDELQAVVTGQLYAQYPDCRIERLSDEALGVPKKSCVWTIDLHLVPDIFPIKRYGQFEDTLNRTTADSLTALLATLTWAKNNSLHGHIVLTVRPARAARIARAKKCLGRLASPFFQSHPHLADLYLKLALSPRLSLRLASRLLGRLARLARSPEGKPFDALRTSSSRLHEREADLQAASDKLGHLLFEARLQLVVRGPKEEADRARMTLRLMAGPFGLFHLPRLAAFLPGPVRSRWSVCRFFRPRCFLLSTEEVASLWHPPNATVRAPALRIVESRELEPPVNLPTPNTHPDLTTLGMTAFRSQRQRFGILPDDLRRHLAVFGKTGMGKTSLLYQLISSDIRAGSGLALVDPHGDLAADLLTAIPPCRTNDTIYLDAADTAFPIAFNPLACRSAGERPLVAAGIIAAFKKLWGDFWGPRLEHILRNALLALLEVPGTSLVSLLQLLSDSSYRKTVVSRVTDPVVRAFWEKEFSGMPPKLQAEAIAPIQNKAGAFISNPILRNLLGQAEDRLDLRRIMDEGKVLIANVSKGRIGEDASALLGSLLISSIQIAAMGRAELPEEKRADFGLYVDEFGQFATASFATILSEARKYHLLLTVAGQYLAQMDEATAAAVFGNIGTMIIFQVGAQDAEVLAEQLGGLVQKDDLLTLPRYRAYVRLLIDGVPSRPFSMETIPPSANSRDHRRPDSIRRCCRRHYGRPVADVATDIQAAFTRR